MTRPLPGSPKFSPELSLAPLGPGRNGLFFFLLLDQARSQPQGLCARSSLHLESSCPESYHCHIHVTTQPPLKCHLLREGSPCLPIELITLLPTTCFNIMSFCHKSVSSSLTSLPFFFFPLEHLSHLKQNIYLLIYGLSLLTICLS